MRVAESVMSRVLTIRSGAKSICPHGKSLDPRSPLTLRVNKSLGTNARSVTDRLLSFAGTREMAVDSKKLKFARRAPRSKGFVRHVCWICRSIPEPDT